ncbi:MAG TPA: hypothetical protein VGB75_19205 [Jatrophihabitans sp.]|uniref:hypothetical protein n=1 Tax=Jatrophihabitans sp. TaxID=1932789 RepID=UPI002EE1DAE5
MSDDLERELAAAAAALNERHQATGIEVLVERRWRGVLRAHGLCAYDLWTDVFEPVRQRWAWSRRWRCCQAPEDAARKIDWFLTHRPDLPPGAG